jgi:hypothetical protein
MVNLIPKKEKKKMIMGFRLRLVTLFLLTLDFCILVTLVVLLPSYFLSITKNSVASAKLETQKLDPALVSEELAVIEDINNKLDLIEKAEKNKFLLSADVINAILLKKRSDIKITQISYQNDARGKKIGVTGTAPSREVLLLFRLALESSPAFKSVDLPISNFVKGSNIQFYLNLIPAEK